MITGSAMRKLMAITGLEVKQLSPTCYSICIIPAVSFYSFVSDEKKACEQLRQQNWARVVREACERAEWKCERCKQRKPLQGHHKIHRSLWKRSDGPLDALCNVSAICPDCHEQDHRPAPSMKVTRPSDDLKEIDLMLGQADREDEQSNDI